MEKDEDQEIVKDGEAVKVSFLIRDSGRTAPLTLKLGDQLRDLDNGTLLTLDDAHVAAIQTEAARSGLTVSTYLRDCLRYDLDRAAQ